MDPYLGDCMKNRYRSWHLPLLSFYSQRLYADVSNRWKNTNLGFLFILIALCLIPASRQMSREAVALIDHHASLYLMQIPPMHITNGHLSVEAPQPYSIIQGNHTVLLIDTTGKITTLEAAGSSALLTATNLLISQKSQAPFIYDLTSIETLELNKEIVGEFVERIKSVILPSYYLISLIFTSIAFLLSALLFGALALLFGFFQQKSLNYTTGIRISVVAFTPPLILSTLFRMAGWKIPAILYILLALAYLYLIVGACRPRETDEVYLDNEPITH